MRKCTQKGPAGKLTAVGLYGMHRAKKLDKVLKMDERQLLEAASGRTILIIEDNEMNREILVDFLEDQYHILQAENGKEGLELLEKYADEISAILLDVMMPVMNGYEFLEHKGKVEAYGGIPVIVTTASNSVDDEIKCLQLGATDFVTKPYNNEVVRNRLNSAIRLRGSIAILDEVKIDNLTGLYSVKFFYRNVENILSRFPDNHYIIVCSDIEKFKMINERYGRLQADDLLAYTARTLMERLPGCVIGGRIRADVCAFLLRDAVEEDITDVLINEIAAGAPVPNTVIDYGVIDADTDHSCQILCDRAMLALDSIKGKYGIYHASYNDDIRKKLLMEQHILDGMEEALAQHQFQAYYQPKHDLKTDRTGGAEALVRWIHPELGFMNPGMFIPLFEMNGFIRRLDYYIWEEVCRFLSERKKAGKRVVPVSINMSRRDFDAPDLVEKLIGLLDQYELDHNLLHLEVTESAYVDNPDHIYHMINELKTKGFSFELDDFGSGYSSLAILNTVPFDVMKLDMSLIRQDDPTDDESVLAFTVKLAKMLHMKTVAEGVETEAQADRLHSLDADYIQGYYYSKPLPRDQFEAYLDKEDCPEE